MASEKDYLGKINGELKAAKIGVSVRQKGNRLYLRATLPPKPNSPKLIPHQQDISLGINANPAGYKRAKAEAVALGGLLACKEFNWEPYLKLTLEPETPKTKTVADWIKEFEIDYFTRRARNPKSETTYQGYRGIFRKLNPDMELSADLLKQAIFASPPDSRTRIRHCMVLGKLAKFAGIELDASKYKGNYSPFDTPRNIPEEKLIYEWREKFFSPQWQWVYGILAVYGLRPHEVFNLDYEEIRSGSKVITVLDGKTGRRRVWPFPLDWWEEWRLWEVQLPKVTGKNNSIYGARVSTYFRKFDCPFKPYDLRHAWAVRTMLWGLDISLASQQMGHSVQIHSQTYHHWISERHHQQAFEQVVASNQARFSGNV